MEVCAHKVAMHSGIPMYSDFADQFKHIDLQSVGWQAASCNERLCMPDQMCPTARSRCIQLLEAPAIFILGVLATNSNMFTVKQSVL